MKIIIYPDYETDITIYEKMDSEVIVYDENNTYDSYTAYNQTSSYYCKCN